MERDVIRSSYSAKIIGPHPTYLLNRAFLTEGKYEDFPYDLPDGVYEFATKFYDRETCEYLGRERTWFVMFDGIYHEYDDGEMNYQYVLYTVFLIRLQTGGAA